MIYEAILVSDCVPAAANSFVSLTTLCGTFNVLHEKQIGGTRMDLQEDARRIVEFKNYLQYLYT